MSSFNKNITVLPEDELLTKFFDYFELCFQNFLGRVFTSERVYSQHHAMTYVGSLGQL